MAAYLLDTNVAIHLRDRSVETIKRVASLGGGVTLSAITRVELENGVCREPAHAAIRRARIDKMLESIPTVDFDEPAIKAYAQIVAHAGYSRRKVLDRMIAAQAMAQGAILVTMNATDFADIPGLQILAW